MKTTSTEGSSPNYPNTTRHTKRWHLSDNMFVEAIFASNIPCAFASSHLYVVNAKEGWEERPYNVDGTVFYDHPERMSKTTRKAVERAYRWLSAQLKLYRKAREENNV